MDFQQQQIYLNSVRAMADEAADEPVPFIKHGDQQFEHRDITFTEEQLLAMAMSNLGEYIHDNSPHYVLIEDDPRNEDDYDTWEYGTEPLPDDHTWRQTSVDVNVSPSTPE
jgi:hypothetical protein